MCWTKSSERLTRLNVSRLSEAVAAKPGLRKEGHGELVYKEFKHLMDLLILREGFTSSEYDQFMEMFVPWPRFMRTSPHRIGGRMHTTCACQTTPYAGKI